MSGFSSAQPKALAVNSDHLPLEYLVDRLNPLQKDRLKSQRVEQREKTPKRIV